MGSAIRGGKLMKLVGIIGSNSDVSYNRILMQYVEKAHRDLFELDVVEITDVPMFNVSDDKTDSPVIQDINRRVAAADGVIIATPEHNHTVPPALKSLIEYLTYKVHPFEGKPVMIIGASLLSQGTSRAQLHLRQILEAPGAGAFVFPGNEFLLGDAKSAFDDNGNLKDPGTSKFLRETLQKYLEFAGIINQLNPHYNKDADAQSGASEEAGDDATTSASQQGEPKEDLWSTEDIDTTIKGLDKEAEDWVEQASEKTKAVSGDDYVKLNHGVLTVNQINYMLKTVSYEATYADDNNQFIYYNHTKPKEAMLGGRMLGQVGSSLAGVHPDRTFHNVSYVIEQLRSGNQDEVRVRIPGKPGQFKIHNYRAMHDSDGRYRGIHEMIFDLQPWVDWYFEQTGGLVVKAEDATSSASVSADDEKPDANTSASESSSDSQDAVTSATSKAATEAEDLWASSSIKTTIEGVDKDDENWVEKAAEITNAAEGEDYVQLDRGILTVNQINWLLETLPYEATYADNNNQFIYYNFTKAKEDMLGGRQPWQVGSSLAKVHPDRAFAGAAWVVNQLRNGREYVRVRIPGAPGQFKVHNYVRMEDENGEYAGIHEMIFDLQPWIDWYLEHNQGKHTATDATSGASQKTEVKAEAFSGEDSTHLTMNPKQQGATADAVTGASESDHSGSTTSKGEIHEDMFARHVVDTTIIGLDKDADDWVEQAAEKTNAAKGSDYVQLDRGVLTVDQINWMLSTLPYEATFADDNNQFIYYNQTKPRHEMLGGRDPWQVGSSLGTVHPERANDGAAWVVNQLRTGEKDAVTINIPGAPGQFKIHHYVGMHDANEKYRGVHEMIFDLQPWIDWYLKETGQSLTGGKDATTSASQTEDNETATPIETPAPDNDATSGATE